MALTAPSRRSMSTFRPPCPSWRTQWRPETLLNTSLQSGSALGLAALAAIASIVTRSHLPGQTMAVARTDGYIAGLLAGSVIFAAGALVAVLTINARVSAPEAAGH
jgi:hypothetical protein